MKKTIIFSVTILWLVGILSGCSQQNQLKKIVVQAIDQQANLTSYHFSGNAKLEVTDELLQSSNQIAIQFLKLLNHSTMEWSGIAQVNPSRLEMDLTITPADSGQKVALPIILSEEQLWVKLPMINSLPDEYTLFHIPARNMNPSGANASKISQNDLQIIFSLFAELFSQAPSDWYNQPASPSKDFQLSPSKQIVIEWNPKKQKSFTEIFVRQWSKYAETLAENGLIDSSFRKSFATLNGFAWQAPSQFSIEVNKDGWIEKQSMEANLTRNSNTTPQEMRISFSQSYQLWNQPVQFTKPRPIQYLDWSKLVDSIR